MVIFHPNNVLKVRTITDTGIVLVPYYVIRVDNILNGEGHQSMSAFRNLNGHFLVSLIEGQFGQTRIVNLIVAIRTVETWVEDLFSCH